MPLPLCPRCGKVEKRQHVCTGNLKPDEDSRKSVKRQMHLDSRKMSSIEVEEDVRRMLDEIRAALVRETGKTRVTYNEAIKFLLKSHDSATIENG
jgi:hypothetical protein